MSDDPFDLERFVKAQGGVYERALEELRRGRKHSHWIWYIFPQLKGLGRSSTSEFYGLSGLEEAKSYLAHPVLGPRLVECAKAVNALESRSAEEIFGFPDWMKFRSSMTLFALADPGQPEFREVLEKLFGGEGDAATTERIR